MRAGTRSSPYVSEDGDIMEIKVDTNVLRSVIEAIKQLPVQGGNFEDADQWVGIVMVLEQMIQQGQEPETAEE